MTSTPTTLERNHNATTTDIRSRREGAEARNVLTVAYSGDPDDAFALYGLVRGAIASPGRRRLEFSSSTIEDLNERAIRGEHAVSAISTAAYPFVHERYAISSAGTSVARRFGPLLASKRFDGISDLRGRKVATPGPLTSGNLLFRMICPDVEVIYMPFDEIRDAISREEVAAGVLIHEELLNYKEVGLRKIRCLGEAWRERTQAPLPVGINIIRRDMGDSLGRAFADALRRSILYGLDYPALAFEFARGYSIALKDSFIDDFIEEFANADTVRLDGPTLRALRLLIDLACDINEMPRLNRLDVL